jgi:hypothetical protein
MTKTKGEFMDMAMLGLEKIGVRMATRLINGAHALKQAK